MSNKLNSGRTKRPEKEGVGSEQKLESERPKGESKGGENNSANSKSRPSLAADRPHHGRNDRSDSRFHGGRDSKGPPMGRGRDKDDRGGGWKKREWADKIDRGSHRGGRLDLGGHRSAGGDCRRDDRASRDRDYLDKKSGMYESSSTQLPCQICLCFTLFSLPV